ncbi:unnamed protein product [Brugia pahangi]|uniref:Transposase n=1 Tax=Brugia pahangi TaxID=6280 RepID=A0A0N4TM87_BRUPA|nr:unnamed protein product [Brugia pahangi]
MALKTGLLTYRCPKKYLATSMPAKNIRLNPNQWKLIPQSVSTWQDKFYSPEINNVYVKILRSKWSLHTCTVIDG